MCCSVISVIPSSSSGNNVELIQAGAVSPAHFLARRCQKMRELRLADFRSRTPGAAVRDIALSMQQGSGLCYFVPLRERGDSQDIAHHMVGGLCTTLT